MLSPKKDICSKSGLPALWKYFVILVLFASLFVCFYISPFFSAMPFPALPTLKRKKYPRDEFGVHVTIPNAKVLTNKGPYNVLLFISLLFTIIQDISPDE